MVDIVAREKALMECKKEVVRVWDNLIDTIGVAFIEIEKEHQKELDKLHKEIEMLKISTNQPRGV